LQQTQKYLTVYSLFNLRYGKTGRVKYITLLEKETLKKKNWNKNKDIQPQVAHQLVSSSHFG